MLCSEFSRCFYLLHQCAFVLVLSLPVLLLVCYLIVFSLLLCSVLDLFTFLYTLYLSLCSDQQQYIMLLSHSLCVYLLQFFTFDLCLCTFLMNIVVYWCAGSTKTSRQLVATDLHHYFIKIHCSPFLSPKTLITSIKDGP